MVYCFRCGTKNEEDATLCTKCGASLIDRLATKEFILATTPIVSGYRVKKVLGVVTGLTPRTTNVLGKFVAGIQSMFGGEITAFTAELEKARLEAIERAKSKAIALGANAVIGLDLETSDLGLEQGIVVVSATGTAVILEKET